MEQIIKPQNLSLSHEQLLVLMPYLIVAVGAMATLLFGVFFKAKSNLVSFLASLATVAAAAYAVCEVWNEPSIELFNRMLIGDHFGNLFNALFLLSTGLVLLGSYSYLEKEKIHHSEYYALVLFSCLGMMFLSSARDLVVLFVALETMSIGVYVLVGFRRADVKSNEAALKYFILGSAASAILLYGVTLLYGALGTMNISDILAQMKSQTTPNPLLNLGAIFVISGFLFKVASVPFHMWMPDVYEGAPTIVTSFMTTGLKAAAFASFVRIFSSLSGSENASSTLSVGLHNVLWVVALLTMFIGNITALTQRNLKRMLAYSSIAHTGYILVGILSAAKSESSYSPVLVYLVGYLIMNLGAFAVLALIGKSGDKNTNLEDLAGFGFSHPLLGFAMLVFMFSMAGVPPTVGFLGKYFMFSSAVQAGEVPLVVLAVLCSAISAYYYLRVLVYMYMKEPTKSLSVTKSWATSIVLFVTTAATLQLGMFPGMVIQAAKKAFDL